MRKLPMVLLATAALPLAVNAANTEFSFGGYIKMDAMLSTYSDGDIAPANIGRDFYVPSTIPVGGQDEGADLDYSAKSTRLNMKTVTTLEDGETVTGFIEMDFLSSPGGTEVVSNSYNIAFTSLPTTDSSVIYTLNALSASSAYISKRVVKCH